VSDEPPKAYPSSGAAIARIVLTFTPEVAAALEGVDMLPAEKHWYSRPDNTPKPKALYVEFRKDLRFNGCKTEASKNKVTARVLGELMMEVAAERDARIEKAIRKFNEEIEHRADYARRNYVAETHSYVTKKIDEKWIAKQKLAKKLGLDNAEARVKELREELTVARKRVREIKCATVLDEFENDEKPWTIGDDPLAPEAIEKIRETLKANEGFANSHPLFGEN
jgi:hypothetical protein